MSSLSSLGVSPSLVAKLLEADFVQDADVMHLKPTELSSASQLTLKESSDVIRLVNSSNTSLAFQATSLKQIFEKEDETNQIVTFCQSIDELLGGGIPLGTMTEISGTPGIGKTQMCLQTCVSVQLPEKFGGVGGEAVYIDTEGSFAVSRLKEMAIWAEKHINQVHQEGVCSTFNSETILKGVYYFRCHSHHELLAVIKHLNSFLQDHLKVRLIVIDSIAFHFRHDFTDMMARTSILCSITHDLIQQAKNHRLAVVVTNQMTTRIESSGTSQLVAALGETWGHCPTIRIYLHWRECLRTAQIIKAPHVANGSVYFQVTAGGIRDKKVVTIERNENKRRKLNVD